MKKIVYYKIFILINFFILKWKNSVYFPQIAFEMVSANLEQNEYNTLMFFVIFKQIESE